MDRRVANVNRECERREGRKRSVALAALGAAAIDRGAGGDVDVLAADDFAVDFARGQSDLGVGRENNAVQNGFGVNAAVELHALGAGDVE